MRVDPRLLVPSAGFDFEAEVAPIEVIEVWFSLLRLGSSDFVVFRAPNPPLATVCYPGEVKPLMFGALLICGVVVANMLDVSFLPVLIPGKNSCCYVYREAFRE